MYKNLISLLIISVCLLVLTDGIYGLYNIDKITYVIIIIILIIFLNLKITK
jgi:hypothetical protein